MDAIDVSKFLVSGRDDWRFRATVTLGKLRGGVMMFLIRGEDGLHHGVRVGGGLGPEESVQAISHALDLLNMPTGANFAELKNFAIGRGDDGVVSRINGSDTGFKLAVEELGEIPVVRKRFGDFVEVDTEEKGVELETGCAEEDGELDLVEAAPVIGEG